MKIKTNNSIMVSVVSLAIAIGLFIPTESFGRNPVIAVEKRDSNGDNRVSPKEWGKSKKIFDKIDDNGDGYITAEEFAKKWGIPMPGKKTKKRTAADAGTLDESETIIADVHMHPHPDNHPVDVLTWMNRNGVKWAGNGAMMGGREVRELYAKVMGVRYIPFGGQSQLNQIFFEDGEEGLENPDNHKFKELMVMLREDFEAGKLKGIGEIFANNSTTSKMDKLKRKMRVDAATNRAMMDLVADYGGVLSIHVQWDSDSVEQLESLAKYNTKANIIMAHCGSTSSAYDVRDILKNNPNIYCDLSARHPPKLHSRLMQKKPEMKIFTSSGLVNSWKELIEEMPDRFMVGTDIKTENDYDKSISTIRSGLLSNLSSQTAEKVAYRNAEVLLGLE